MLGGWRGCIFGDEGRNDCCIYIFSIIKSCGYYFVKFINIIYNKYNIVVIWNRYFCGGKYLGCIDYCRVKGCFISRCYISYLDFVVVEIRS